MTTCCEQLIAEHRQTEAGLLYIRQTLQSLSQSPQCVHPASLWASLQAFYQAWAADLYQHFVLEEEALFTLLSPYRSMMLMSVEHDDLWALQLTFARSLRQSVDAAKATPDLWHHFEAFEHRLQGHIMEEERGIFPLAESLFLPEEQALALRRLQALKVRAEQAGSLLLQRSTPGFQLRRIDFGSPVHSPLHYELLYDREQASVQHIRMQAGFQQALHWVGQHQFLLLLSGAVTLHTKDTQQALSPGHCLVLDSQFYFALQAQTDAHLLNFRVWPHPHYTKTLSQAASSPQ